MLLGRRQPVLEFDEIDEMRLSRRKLQLRKPCVVEL
jgi:hypothetical protein